MFLISIMVGRVSRLKTWKNLTNITKKTVERMNKGENEQMSKCTDDEMYKQKNINKLILIVCMAIGAVVVKVWGGV